MNVLNITGNLTRDPESHQVGDKTVCNFTVAVNRRHRRDTQSDQPEADFFRVSAWGRTGENCQKFLTKGQKVGVTGSVSVHPYLAQDGTARANLEVLANDVEFLSSNSRSEQPAESSAPVAASSGGTPVETDELPF